MMWRYRFSRCLGSLVELRIWCFWFSVAEFLSLIAELTRRVDSLSHLDPPSDVCFGIRERKEMGDVPDDLIEDILLRLPVISLLRFKSVSKTWCELIKSTAFVKQHLNCSILTKTNYNLILYCLTSLDQAQELVPPKNPGRDMTILIGSCNGLLCLCYNDCLNPVIIWNPATRKHVKVNNHFPRECPKIVAHGFGYDSVSDDYKVVLLYQNGVGNYCSQTDANVYSLRLDSWRKKNLSHGFLMNFWGWHVVSYIGGCLHVRKNPNIGGCLHVRKNPNILLFLFLHLIS